MKKSAPIIMGILFIIVVIAGFFISSYNGIVSAEENVDGQFAAVETQLQRRFDLIPNLVNATKGYMELEGALSRLLMITENYPALKADAQFQTLMDELAGTENRISVERNRYNESVKMFNSKIRKFPTSVVARLMGVEKRDYFEAQSGAEQAPNVEF